MADVDGVAMTSKSAASGFAFDKTKTALGQPGAVLLSGAAHWA